MSMASEGYQKNYTHRLHKIFLFNDFVSSKQLAADQDIEMLEYYLEMS